MIVAEEEHLVMFQKHVLGVWHVWPLWCLPLMASRWRMRGPFSGWSIKAKARQGSTPNAIGCVIMYVKLIHTENVEKSSGGKPKVNGSRK